MCKLFSFIVYYRVLLLFLFMACQWHCPLPVISNKIHGTLMGNHRWRIDPCRFQWPWM